MEPFQKHLKPQSLKTALASLLPPHLLPHVKRAFDIIGDIAILEIPEELVPHERIIAEALLQTHPNVKAVYKKGSAMEGTFRIRQLIHLAGEQKTETIHRESGCSFFLDVAKVYFSPRLSHERLRLARACTKEDEVLVLFAGVGPFPIVIAKHARCHCVGVELNPHACTYFRHNIALNKLNSLVEAIEDDVTHYIPTSSFVKSATRILMPLPKTSHEFLPLVVAHAQPETIITIYGFTPRTDPFTPLLTHIHSATARINRSAEIVFQRRVRHYSPSTDQVVVDFKLL